MLTEFSWLLKIVLVNLNYWIGVHMNFAQSQIPALFCSLQSEYGCHQARSYGGQRGNATPNSKDFGLIQYLKYKSKKTFSANQRNCLKEPILLQFLVEHELVPDLLYQWPASKNNWSNAFRSSFGRTSLPYPEKLLCKLHFKTIPNLSLIAVPVGVTNITYPCFQCQHSLNQWFSKWSISTPRGRMDHLRVAK